MEAKTAQAPVATRNRRQPRPLSTYRGARRNAGRDNWPEGGSVYEPYKTKPDRFRLVNMPDGKGGVKLSRERYARPQPKKYPAGWRSLREWAAMVKQIAEAA